MTFNNAGRLGNYLYEFCCAWAYAKKYELEFTVPQERDKIWCPVYFKYLIKNDFDPNNTTIHLWENGHSYQPLEFKEEWRSWNIVIEGYRQNEKYFQEYRDELLCMLSFDWHLKEGWVSLHNRLGDYKQHPDKHHNISDDYIAKALNYFSFIGIKNCLVFSDGMDETKSRVNSDIYQNYHFEYSEGRDEIEDLVLGSYCEHNIISASTFSWWQAWLGRNENKIVIAPNVWFEYNNSHLDDRDIIPERWIKIA